MANSIARSSNKLEIMQYFTLILHHITLLPNHKRTIRILFELMGAMNEPFIWNNAKQIVFKLLF